MYCYDARAYVLSLLDASLEVQNVRLGELAEARRGIGESISERVASCVTLRENARKQSRTILVRFDPGEAESPFPLDQQLDQLGPEIAVGTILLLNCFADPLRIERSQGLRSLDQLCHAVAVVDNVACINDSLNVEPSWKVLDGIDNGVEFCTWDCL